MNSIETTNIQTGNSVTVIAHDNFASYTELLPGELVFSLQWTPNGSVGMVTDLATGGIIIRNFEATSCLDDALVFDSMWLSRKYFPEWNYPQTFGV